MGEGQALRGREDLARLAQEQPAERRVAVHHEEVPQIAAPTRPYRRGLWAVPLCIVLGACAAVPRGAPRLPPPSEHPATFEINGRVGVKLNGDGYSARLRWQHTPQRDGLWIYSPIGSLVAAVTRDADGAVLLAGNGEKFSGESLGPLMHDVLGWELPVEQMQYWVRGLQAPDTEPTAVERDHQGRLLKLEQDRWQISYLAYNGPKGTHLPYRLDVRNGKVRLRLVIEDWKFDDLDT